MSDAKKSVSGPKETRAKSGTKAPGVVQTKTGPSEILALEMEIDKARLLIQTQKTTEKDKNKLQRTEKTQKTKIVECGKQIKRVYESNKRTVSEMEEDNYDKLILLRSSGAFWKFVGKSALYYATEIAPRASLSANLLADQDFVAPMDEGKVSLKNEKVVLERLAQIKIKVDEAASSGDVIVLRLPWKYTEKDVAKMLEQGLLKKQTFNKVVMPQDILPALYAEIRELMSGVYNMVRKWEATARECYGYDLVRVVSQMEHAYLNYANGRTMRYDLTTGRSIMAGKIQDEVSNVAYQMFVIVQNCWWCKNQLKVVSNLKLCEVNAALRLSNIAVKIEKIATKEMRK